MTSYQQDPMPVFVIKAKDKIAPLIVAQYAEACRARGWGDQAAEVDKALDEINEWRDRHRDLVKVPDHKHAPAAQDRKVVLSRLRLPLDAHRSDLLLIGDSFEEGGRYVQFEVPRAEFERWTRLIRDGLALLADDRADQAARAGDEQIGEQIRQALGIPSRAKADSTFHPHIGLAVCLVCNRAPDDPVHTSRKEP